VGDWRETAFLAPAQSQEPQILIPASPFTLWLVCKPTATKRIAAFIAGSHMGLGIARTERKSRHLLLECLVSLYPVFLEHSASSRWRNVKFKEACKPFYNKVPFEKINILMSVGVAHSGDSAVVLDLSSLLMKVD